MTKILLRDDRIYIATPYNPTLVKAFGQIPGRKWYPDEKEWSFPMCCRVEVVKALGDLLKPAARDEILKAYFVDMNPQEYTKQKLYPYQEFGVRYLLNNRKVILADSMGLGKTPQSLIACAYLLEQKKIDAVLIFAPKSLKAQWKAQIFKFLDTEDVCLVEGNQKKRLDLYTAGHRFYIFNYETIIKDLPWFDLLPSRLCIILDEAQRIKNWRSKISQSIKELDAKYKFVLTGTPLENNLLELYSINSFIDNGIFGGIGAFNSRFVVRNEWGAVTNYKNLKYLHEILTHVMLRRRKQDVDLDLPELIVSEYNISLSPDEISDYNKIASPIYAALKTPGISPNVIFGSLTLLRCYVGHPDIVRNSKSKLAAGLKLKAKTSSKFIEFQEIIKDLFDSGVQNCVVYTSFVEMQKILATWLTGKYPFTILKGGMDAKEIQSAVDEFKTGNTQIFLSTDSGALGLNLENCSTIINYDIPYNPAIISQRISRLHRIGQKNNVVAINLHVSELNNIEEHIKKIVGFKTDLFAQIIDGEGGE